MATINISGNDLVRDPGLETAIVVTLFTDQRADSQIDTLPDNKNDLRGWWGDQFDEFPLGSKTWLLYRSKTILDVEQEVSRSYTEALQWMVSDGAVKSISANAVRSGQDTLLITVTVEEPDGQQRFYKYAFNWEAEELKRGE